MTTAALFKRYLECGGMFEEWGTGECLAQILKMTVNMMLVPSGTTCLLPSPVNMFK